MYNLPEILHAEMAMSRVIFRLSKEDFGKTIRRLRERIEIEPMELAYRLGVTLDVVRNWETGRSYPDAPQVVAILNLCPDARWLREFGLDIDKLGGQNPSPPGAPQVPKNPLTETPREADITPEEGKIQRRVNAIRRKITNPGQKSG
jgi:transcriptional regulator with XRE-family HTH domain